MKQILLLLLLFLLVIYASKSYSSELSSYEQLKQSWQIYKSYFIQNDGRVMDFYSNSITTSEGQSYALLRSVWLNDKNTFDNVLNWTNSNLKVRGDNLYSWKWGENKNGEWTIIDRSNATDADEDIALALILAYEKWNDKKYLAQAKNTLKDIWNKTVVNIKGNNYLTAGDWATKDENIKLNPSYFSPYAYRIFAKYDNKHDWLSLVSSSYDVLNKASQQSAFYLPPDWCYINKKTGNITIDKQINPKESDYSYDAIRVHWRIALDYILNNDKSALNYLNKSTKSLIKYWEINDNLPTAVTIDGIIREPHDSYAIYGCALPAIALVNKKVGKEIYHKKIAAEYIKGFWANPKDYYSQNVIWFGLSTFYNIGKKPALSKRGLVNLLN